MPSVARLAAAALPALAACAGVLRPPSPPLQPPRLTVEAFLPVDADATGVTLVVQGRVENPNPVDVWLIRWAYQLEVEAQPAGSGHLAANQLLRRGAAVPVTVPARLGWASVPGFAVLAATRQSVAVRMRGAASVRLGSGSVELPFAAEGPAALPRPPRVALQGAAVREAGLFQTVIELRLAVQNPNAFPLPVGRLAYDLLIGGSPVVRAASASLDQVPPGGTAAVVVPVTISSVGALTGIVAGAQRGSPEVVLRGQAEYGALGVALEARALLGGR